MTGLRVFSGYPRTRTDGLAEVVFFSASTRGDEGDGPPLPAEAAFLKIPASVPALRSVAGLFVGVGAECIDACFLTLDGERLFSGLPDSKQAPRPRKASSI